MVDITLISPTLNNTCFMNNLMKNLKVLDESNVSYEYIVVSPYDISINHRNVIFTKKPKLGIYQAMNEGVEKASGKLLYFIGDDDYIFRDFPLFINQVLKNNSELGIANVKYSNGRIYRNVYSNIFLLFRNWNHQGILYNRDFFKKYLGIYDVRYPIQADHHANITLSSRAKKVTRFKKNVAMFCSDGVSGRIHDEAFHENFPKLVLKIFGPTYYYFVVLKRTLKGLFIKW
jgi:glycosyltransferase involved in cell wall biosynthesis